MWKPFRAPSDDNQSSELADAPHLMQLEDRILMSATPAPDGGLGELPPELDVALQALGSAADNVSPWFDNAADPSAWLGALPLTDLELELPAQVSAVDHWLDGPADDWLTNVKSGLEELIREVNAVAGDDVVDDLLAQVPAVDQSIVDEPLAAVLGLNVEQVADWSPAAPALSQEVVFIDTAVEDYQQLLSDLQAQQQAGRNLDIVLLDSAADGVSQISETLSGYDNVEAVHLVTHGSAGEIRLGSTTLSLENLGSLAGELNQWGAAFAADGDLLIYGCEVASNAQGQSLISAVAAICDCDVTASDDLTGQASRGGDWDFEYVVGSIETELAFSDFVQAGWGGLLTATNITDGVTINADGGNDTYMQASAPNLLGGLDAITYEASFQANLTGADFALASYGVFVQDDDFVVEVTGGNDLRLQINGATALTSNFDASALNDGDIHHVAVSWDSTNGDWKVYFDGELTDYGTGLEAGRTLRSNGEFVIGNDQDTPGGLFDPLEYFSGTLHDVRVWGAVRTAEEIALNYQHKFDVTDLPVKLIANWQMDDVTVTDTIVDVVGGNDLQVSHTTAAGFNPSVVVDDLNVDEDVTAGTVVGYVMPVDSEVHNNIVGDGQFLEAGIPATDQDYSVPATMGGWRVVQSDVHLLGDTYERTPLGGLGVDLNGNGSSGDTDAPGIIQQTLTTEIGKEYQITFAFSGNWTGGEATKDLRVTAGGDFADFSITQGPGWSPTNMQWEHRSLTFTATSTSTTLQFGSLDNTPDYGPVIGDVQVIEVPQAIQSILTSDPTLTFDAATGKFYRVSAGVEFWGDANTTSQGSLLNGVAGSLVSVESAYENALLQGMAQTTGGDLWLGGTDQTTEGDFHWQTATGDGERFWAGGASGSALGYANWQTAPRSPGTGEDYVVMNQNNGKWVDYGDGVMRYYVTEWDASEVIGARTFAISDPSNNFDIDPVTGAISVRSGHSINYEAATSHTVDVTAISPATGAFVQAVTIYVNDVDDSPVVALPVAPIAYIENDVPVVLAGTATVTDPDSVDFAGGNLTVTMASGGTADDRLTIRHEGTAAGEVGLSGSSVMVGGTVVGSFTGGQGVAPLVVTFNASADAVAVEAVAQNVAYFNVSDTVSTAPRQVSFQVDDGDGNTSLSPTVDLAVTAVQDAPIALNDRHGVNFDGTDDYVLVTDSPSLTMSNAVTMEAWVKQDASANSPQIIVNKEGEYEMALFSDGSLYWALANGDPGWNWHDTGYDVPIGQWAHVAVSYQNGIVSSYVNGNLVDVYHGSGLITDSHDAMDSLRIGARENNPAGQFFDGEISEVRIWSVGRSQTEIRDNMRQPLTGAQIGLQGYWKFDEGRGPIAADASGNGNDGTLGNGAVAEAPSWNGYPITEDATLSVPANGVLTTDFDPDGDALTVTEMNGSALAVGAPTILPSGARLTLNANGSFAYDTNGAFDWLPQGQTTTDSFTYTVDDGAGNTDTAVVTLKINGLNDLPVITNLDGDVTLYTPKSGPQVVEAGGDAVLTDDSPDFDGGSVVVTINVNEVVSEDVLGVRDQGTGAGQIGAVGSIITYEGVTIGSAASVLAGGYPAMIISLNANATPTAVEALLHNITYENTNNTPTPGARNLMFTVSDGDGGTSASHNVTVNFLPPATANPIVAFGGGAVTYTENAAPVFIDSAGSVTDVDSLDFDTGTMTVSLTNSEATDQLLIFNEGTAPGEIGVSGTNVTYNAGAGAAVIGTFAGGNGAAPLVINFNASATPAAAEALLQNLQFHTVSEDPSTVARDVQVVLTDGDGGTSSPVTKSINVTAVNDAPTMSLSGGVAYTENDPATRLAPSATVADVDSPDFNGGVLTVRLTTGGAPEDRLSVAAVGNGAGQVNVSGTDVLYEGVVVATMSGGSDGTTPLVIAFNASADATAVEAIAQSVTFENLSENPTATRDFDFDLTDGDGGTVLVADAVTLTAVNDAPLNQVPATTQTVAEDAILTMSSAMGNEISVSDVDAAGADLRVTLTATNGVLQLAGTTGLTSVVGDGASVVTVEGTVANINAALDGMTFSPAPDYYGTAQITVDTNDLGHTGAGGALIDVDVVNINVTPVNDAPVLVVSGNVSYTENAAPVLLAPTAALSDIDSPDFDTGSVTVMLVTGGTSNDRLSIRAVGNGLGQVNVVGTDVLYEGVIVGTMAGGTDGSTPLVVTLNANATAAAVEAVVQSATYENVSEDPTSSRTFSVMVADGDGSSSSSGAAIANTAINDAPWNQVPGPQAVAEDTVLSFGVATGNSITINDLDAGAAVMRVTLTATQGTLNLASTAGLTSVSGDGTGTVTIEGAATDLNVALDGLTFTPTADFNGAAQITVDTNDLGNNGAGGALTDVDVVDINVTPVNDAPVLVVSGNVSYTENAAPVLLTPTATLSDIDSPDFGTGAITVTLVTGGTANDRLSIRAVGNGAGQVNVVGTDVLFEGVIVGTLAGGSDGSTPLVVTLNANATVAAVEAVVQNTMYENVSEDPASSRTFSVTVDDGDGAASSSGAAIAVTAVNDAPQNQVPAAQAIPENTALTFGVATSNPIAISDVDAGAGVLRVTLTATQGVLNLAGTAGLTSVSGDGTPTVTIEGAASDLNVAMDGMTFTPTPNYYGPAQITVDTDDLGNSGAGGALTDSDVVSITVNSVNSAPVVSLSGPVVYVENDLPTKIAAAATISDIDSPDFDTGSVTITLTSGATTNDRLTILAVGNGVGQVNVVGADVLFEGVVIGTFAGGTDGTTPLTVTFNANATVAAVQGVLQQVAYENVSDAPTSSRTFSVDVRDGDGGSVAVVESLSITATNDAPWNQTLAATLSVNEDTVLTLDSGSGTNIYINDVDAMGGVVRVALTATNGTLQLSGTTGLTLVSGDGSAVVTVEGAIGDINAAFDGLTFTPTPDYNGPAQITVETSDMGNTGTGGALVDVDVVNLVVNAVNDTPVASLSGPISYTENDPATLLAPTATITDVDSTFHASSLTVALTGGATDDRLAIRNVGNGVGQVGVTGTDVYFEGVHVATFNGGTDGFTPLTVTFNANASVATAEAVLQNVTFESLSENPSVARTFDVTLQDGDGGVAVVSQSLSLTSVNDAPAIQLPAAAVSTPEDTALSLSSATGTNIVVTDVDAAGGDLQVSLTATNGVLNLATTAALTVVSGDGTAALTIEGAAADLNAALDGLMFTPDADFYGMAQINVDTNDLGNSGTGGSLVDSATLNINVTSVNDAPINQTPSVPVATSEDTLLTFQSGGPTLAVSDVDAANLRVTLSAGDGVLNLSTAAGLIVTGDGTGTVVFEGAVADVNAALDGLTFGPNLNFFGATSITIDTTDLGASGAGGTLSDLDVVSIQVTPVNDAPATTDSQYQVNSLHTLNVSAPGLLSTASDVEGDALAAVLISPPAYGTLTLNPDGSFVYDPLTVFHGTVTFTFAVTDGAAQSNVSTVAIDVAFVGGGGGGGGNNNDNDSSSAVITLPTDSDSDDSNTDVVVLLVPPQAEPEPEFDFDSGVAGAYRQRDAVVQEFAVRVARADTLEVEDVSTAYFVTTSSVSNEAVTAGVSQLASGSSRGFDYDHVLWSQLDAIADSLREENGSAHFVAGTAKVATSVMIAGYAAWSLRAGYAAAWLTSSMPTWIRFDPLPVLQSALPAVKVDDGETLAQIARGG